MAKVEKTSISITSTGETSLITFEDETLDPTLFEFKIGPRTGVSETHSIYSSGWQDINLDRKLGISTYYDGSTNGTRRSTSESITHWKNVSGTLTKLIGGYVSHVEPGGFKITLSAADDDFTIDILAWEL